MVAAKFNLEHEQILFLNQHRELGFGDKSSLVRAAIDRLRQEWEDAQIIRSAELYAEVYQHDLDLQRLTDQAVQSGRNEWTADGMVIDASLDSVRGSKTP